VLENDQAFRRWGIEQRKGAQREAQAPAATRHEGEASARHSGAEGRAGKQDARATGRRMATTTDQPTNEDIVTGRLARLFAERGADSNGTLFGSELGGSGTIFGGALGSAPDQDIAQDRPPAEAVRSTASSIGNVTGEQVGDSFGFGGLGLRGQGPSSGATTSTFGVGNLGVRSRSGAGIGDGLGSGHLGGRGDHGIRISQGTPVVMGSLDKEIIRRVIKENLSQIRYCYERELTKSPGLFGKVQIKFIIAATGLVSNSQVEESTMKNAKVEQCIVQKVRGWRFPKPKGGGIVIVTYPFIFKQSG